MNLLAVVLVTIVYFSISEVSSYQELEHPDHGIDHTHAPFIDRNVANYIAETEFKKNFECRYNHAKRGIEGFNKDKIAKSYFDQVLRYMKDIKEKIDKLLDIADQKFKNYAEVSEKKLLDIITEAESFKTKMVQKTKNKKDKTQVDIIMKEFYDILSENIDACHKGVVHETRYIFWEMKMILDKAYTDYAYICNLSVDCVRSANSRGCSKDLLQDSKDLMNYVDNDVRKIQDSFSSSGFNSLGISEFFVTTRGEIHSRMVRVEKQVDQIL